VLGTIAGQRHAGGTERIAASESEQASIQLIELPECSSVAQTAEAALSGQYLSQPPPVEASVLGLRPGETATARALELTEQIKKLKQENKQLKSKVESLERELAKKEQELREATTALKELTQQAVATRRQLLQWRAELDGLRLRLKSDREQHLEMLRSTVALLEGLVGKRTSSRNQEKRREKKEQTTMEQEEGPSPQPRTSINEQKLAPQAAAQQAASGSLRVPQARHSGSTNTGTGDDQDARKLVPVVPPGHGARPAPPAGRSTRSKGLLEGTTDAGPVRGLAAVLPVRKHSARRHLQNVAQDLKWRAAKTIAGDNP